MNADASTYSTKNTAYGIIDNHDNINLQANECYKSVPAAELASAPPNEGLECSLYTSIPPTRAGH